MTEKPFQLITVGLNPAIDRLIEVNNLRVGDHVTGQMLARQPAGKAANVSRALGRLDQVNIATGFIGADEMSFFEDSFKSCKYTQCQFLKVQGRTRENITLIDQTQSIETHIRDQGFTVQASDIERITAKLSLMAHCESYVVFAGSTPAGLSLDTFRMLIQCALDQGARVVVDTGGTLLAGVIDMPLWLIKPNVGELCEALGFEIRSDDDIRRALDQTLGSIHGVLLSRGKQGAMYATRERVISGKIEVPAEQIINTVGCGDCLLAGFLEGWVTTGNCEASLKRGLSVATANAQELQPACFDVERVIHYMNVVALQEWNT